MKANEHSLTGKIARLPKHIREKLNRRLENGQSATDILPWLNGLSTVKTILAAQFDGVPVSPMNLTNWRADGFKRWQAKQPSLTRLAQLSEDATDITRAGRDRLARAAAALIAAEIMEFFQNTPPEKRTPADLAKLSFAAANLLNADQNQVRLKHEKTRVQQRDEQLFLTRDRDQRDDAAIALRVLHDERAKLIESTPCDYTEKLELIGRQLFGDLWASRLIQPSPVIKLPDPPNFNQAGTHVPTVVSTEVSASSKL